MSTKVRLSQWFFAIIGILLLILIGILILMNQSHQYNKELWLQCLSFNGSYFDVPGEGAGCFTSSMMEFIDHKTNMTLWVPNQTISSGGSP